MLLDPNGFPVKIAEEDEKTPIDPEMRFWIALDQDLVGARNENGYIIPSELFLGLDRWDINHPDNREVAKLMLDLLAVGRNEAVKEQIENSRRRGRQNDPRPRKKTPTPID